MYNNHFGELLFSSFSFFIQNTSILVIMLSIIKQTNSFSISLSVFRIILCMFVTETKYNIYIYEKDMDYHYCRNSCYCCLRNFFV